jgi:phosphoenolpyruvate synthase/pyruvate phosphate dikinase
MSNSSKISPKKNDYPFSKTFKEIKSSEDERMSGGKGRNLTKIYRLGYPVPEGLIVFPSSFCDDKLCRGAWDQIKKNIDKMKRNKTDSFAIRSSTFYEDSAKNSFAGEFDTVLDVNTDEEIKRAIEKVRESRKCSSVKSYSEFRGIKQENEMAVIVQKLIKAEISGVLFTADPITGNDNKVIGNFVNGSGEKLVSGESDYQSFSFLKPKDDYQGPIKFRTLFKKLVKLAQKLEKEFGSPQDIEWAISKNKIFLLQSRPITPFTSYDIETGECNDSFVGDYIWTSTFWEENIQGIMTPSTWSIFKDNPIDKKLKLIGNIAGRPYYNLSIFYTMLSKFMGKEDAIDYINYVFGRLPENASIQKTEDDMIRYFLVSTYQRIRLGFDSENIIKSEILKTSKDCFKNERDLKNVQEKHEMISLFEKRILPNFMRSRRVNNSIVSSLSSINFRLIKELEAILDEKEAAVVLSCADKNINTPYIHAIESKEYAQKNGFTESNEWELYPSDNQNKFFCQSRPINEIKKTNAEFGKKIEGESPDYISALKKIENKREFKLIKNKITKRLRLNYLRVLSHQEISRTVDLVRQFYSKAGELTKLGNDIFFLTKDEIICVLSGDVRPTKYIPARKITYEKYGALPKLPSILVGRFDPFRWADAKQEANLESEISTIKGNPGSYGCVEGVVRNMVNPDSWEEFEKGEILVASTLNTQWIPLILKARAIVTDIGSPMSHISITARELGMPAVVGCGCATEQLKTGDRIFVDGSQGIIKILKKAG